MTRKLILLYLLISCFPAYAVIWDIDFQSDLAGAASGNGYIEFTDPGSGIYEFNAFNFDGVVLGNTFNFTKDDLDPGTYNFALFYSGGVPVDIITFSINQLYFSYVPGSEDHLAPTSDPDMLAGLNLIRYSSGNIVNAQIQCVSAVENPLCYNPENPDSDYYSIYPYSGAWSLTLREENPEPPPSTVPESSTLILMLLGISGLFLVTGRRRKRSV